MTLQPRIPLKWPSKLARFVLLMSELLFAWVLIKIIFAPHKGVPIPYWLFVDDQLSLPLLAIVWCGIIALVIICTSQKYNGGWLLGSVFCALCASIALFALNVWEHMDTAQFDGQTFHLARSIDDRYWGDYLLCQCSQDGNLCHCHEVYAESPPFPGALVTNATTRMLTVVLRRSRYGMSDETVYTLDSEGVQWCKNDFFCETR